MRRLLLTLIMFIALPCWTTWSAEAGTAFKVGSFLQSGSKPVIALTTGTEIVITSDLEKKFQVTNYSGAFHANTNDVVEGVTNLTYFRKYFYPSPTVKLDLALGTGFLYDIKAEENDATPGVSAEFVATIYRWISVGAGTFYLWRSGNDQVFNYVTVNLLTVP